MTRQRNSRPDKDRLLIAELRTQSQATRVITPAPDSILSVRQSHTSLSADQVAAFWRFPLRAEKRPLTEVSGYRGLDPKMHGEVRRPGHLRAPSSHRRVGELSWFLSRLAQGR